jgi:methylamine dehydrogenase heavy chain
MRVIILAASCLALWSPPASSQVAPEEVGTETMEAPGENWFIGKTRNGGYIFDAESGEMHGLISLSPYTSSIEIDNSRKQFYAPESYYSRGVHGERSDVVTIYDFDNLSPVGEVEVPKKVAVLGFRRHVGLLSNGRHLVVFNMTPAQSVSVVDVEERRFVGEISTPGCAMIMPVEDNGFLMICGDGTLQLIQLDEQGNETNRERSKEFFEVLEDPVFDRPVPTADGWLLMSHSGKAFDVTVDGTKIRVSKAWSLLDEEDEEQKWRPGGGEFASLHVPTGLLYVLMHKAEKDYTHHDPGTEIWVMDAGDRRRLGRIELEVPAYSLLVTQSDDPKLVVGDEEGGLHIYDPVKLSLEKTIDDPGPGAAFYVGFQ